MLFASSAPFQPLGIQLKGSFPIRSYCCSYTQWPDSVKPKDGPGRSPIEAHRGKLRRIFDPIREKNETSRLCSLTPRHAAGNELAGGLKLSAASRGESSILKEWYLSIFAHLPRSKLRPISDPREERNILFMLAYPAACRGVSARGRIQLRMVPIRLQRTPYSSWFQDQ